MFSPLFELVTIPLPSWPICYAVWNSLPVQVPIGVRARYVLKQFMNDAGQGLGFIIFRLLHHHIHVL